VLEMRLLPIPGGRRHQRAPGHEVGPARAVVGGRRRVCQTPGTVAALGVEFGKLDRKSTRLNSSHGSISYAVFCLKKKKKLNSMNTSTLQQDESPRPKVKQNRHRTHAKKRQPHNLHRHNPKPHGETNELLTVTRST